MAQCGTCGRTVDIYARFCPGCGREKPGDGAGGEAIVFFLVVIGTCAVATFLAPAMVFIWPFEESFRAAFSTAINSLWAWLGSAAFWVTGFFAYMHWRPKAATGRILICYNLGVGCLAVMALAAIALAGFVTFKMTDGSSQGTAEGPTHKEQPLQTGGQQLSQADSVKPPPSKQNPQQLHPDALSTLSTDLKNSNPEKRIAAAKRLANFGAEARPLVPELILRLDDMNSQVRSAVEEALDKCSPLRNADLVHIEQALKSGGPNSQKYALETFAKHKTLKLSDSNILVVVSYLRNRTPALRALGLQVLANHGPRCRPLAQSAVLDCLADESADVREAANQLIKSWQPFTEADKDILLGALRSDKKPVREFAAGQLAELATEPKSTLEWFKPLLTDKNPTISDIAIKAIAKQGSAGKTCLPELTLLVQAEQPTIALAAIEAVIKVGPAAEVFQILKAELSRKNVPPAIRTRAAKGILELPLADPSVGVSTYAELTKAIDASTRVAALKKLAECGKAAKTEVDVVGERLADPDATVKSAALDVLISLGTDAAVYLTAVQKLATPDEKDGLGSKALRALQKFGPKSSAPLAAALGAKWDEVNAVQIVIALGEFGKEARPSAFAIFDALAKSGHPLADLRKKRVEAVASGMEWEPDPASAALTKIGGDEVAKRLVPLTEWKLEIVKGDKTKMPVNAPDLGTQYWAIVVLASLDPATLDAAMRKSVAAKLSYLAGYDPSAECRKAAKSGAVKYQK